MTKPNTILYDSLIPGFEWAIAHLQLSYEVKVLPDINKHNRAIDQGELNTVFAIFVRSTTQVSEKFIAQFPSLQFIATATSGTDHLDISALESHGVYWCDAKGSNAKGVADYVLYSLIDLYQKQLLFRPGKFVIVGFGCVGTQLAHNLEHLGLHPFWVDPFIDQSQLSRQKLSRSLELSHDIEPWLKSTSVLSIHTPLRNEDPWRTRNWLTNDRLNALPDGAVVIAAGRGEVLDEEAIIAHSPRLTFILDVWPNEPLISQQLLDHVRLATPHIAGHSVLGKLRGTLQVLNQFCQWLKGTKNINKAEFIAQIAKGAQIQERWSVEIEEFTDCCGILNSIFKNVKRSEPMFDLAYEDYLLRHSLRASASDLERKSKFKELRKKYIQHPEIQWLP